MITCHAVTLAVGRDRASIRSLTHRNAAAAHGAWSGARGCRKQWTTIKSVLVTMSTSPSSGSPSGSLSCLRTWFAAHSQQQHGGAAEPCLVCRLNPDLPQDDPGNIFVSADTQMSCSLLERCCPFMAFHLAALPIHGVSPPGRDKMLAYVEKFGRSRVQSMLPHMTVCTSLASIRCTELQWCTSRLACPVQSGLPACACRAGCIAHYK